MSFLQTYYTSCEVGLRGGKGFQFNAVTAGIDPATLQQVERLGLYLPPASAPTRPKPEEIEEFPLALLYQKLANGCVVIAQARYKGLDYSDRYGNYFTHALISTDPQADIGPNGFLPIELWRSEDWKTEPISATELQPLDKIETSGQITLEDVGNFLAGDGRIERLPQFLTAVARALSGERRVVIVDDNENIALWIASACYALPAHLARQVTFNTYVKNPYQTDFLLVGTTSDSDFRFTSQELEYQFFVFDFLNDRFSRLTEVSGFAATVAAFYERGFLEKLAGFTGFVERVAPDLDPAKLDVAMNCYVSVVGLAPPRMNRAEVIAWLAGRLESFSPDDVARVLEAVLAANELDGEVFEACTDLYLAARDPRVREMIEKPYLAALINMISASDDVGTLDAVLRRLSPLDPGARRAAKPLHGVWLGQVKNVMVATRLRALFDLGDKCAFLDEDDEAFRAIGCNVFGPLLREDAARQALLGIVNRPAFQAIIDGVGAYLAADPQAFRASTEILSNPVISQALERYAVEKRNSGFYLRLLMLDQSRRPDCRLRVFQRYIGEVKSWHGESISIQQVDEAFDMIWQGRAQTEDECLNLLEVFQAEQVVSPTLLNQIADFATALDPADLKRLSSQQRKMIGALAKKDLFIHLDDGRKLWIKACFRLLTLDESLTQRTANDKDLEATLKELRKMARFLNSAIRSKLYELAARCLPCLYDADKQFELLTKGFDDFNSNFVVNYGKAVVDLFVTPSAKHYEVMARWFTDRVAPEMRQWSNPQAKQPEYQIYIESFYSALEQWKDRDLVEIGKRLAQFKGGDRDKDITQLWKDWRKNRPLSLISKLKFWN
jgi:hypothetical protein